MNSELRSRAWLVVSLFALTIAYGLVLLLAFDPEVQALHPDHLFARSDDARAFLIADLIFPLLYGIASPIAQWRFGQALTGSRPPRMFIAAAVSLAIAAVLDLVENALLLIAISSESDDLVDAAHAIATPKVISFVIGAALTLVVLVRAARTLRRHRSVRAV